jgi:hypothetical protein
VADLVNLRRFRKAKARAEADKTADANRVAFGRAKAEKTLTAAERAIEARRIDGHKRERAARDDDAS